MNISRYVVVLTAAAAAIALARGISARSKDRKKLTEALERSGLSAPLFVHVDEDDWRSSLGEATMIGSNRRVRFVTNPVPSGDVQLLVADFTGESREYLSLAV